MTRPVGTAAAVPLPSAPRQLTVLRFRATLEDSSTHLGLSRTYQRFIDDGEPDSWSSATKGQIGMKGLAIAASLGLVLSAAPGFAQAPAGQAPGAKPPAPAAPRPAAPPATSPAAQVPAPTPQPP